MTAGGGKASGGHGQASEGATAVKLLEGLQADLRNLCLQIRKKYPHIKESCEDATMQLRSTATSCSSGTSPSAAIAPIAPHVLHPLLQAAHTKDPKIVQLSLGIVQRVVVAGGVVEAACGGQVVEALWLLMEAGVEELRVLQTITLLVTTNDAITGEHLAMALVVALRLHFTKDAVVANTASATVRQLVSAVMERMIAEDRNREACDSEGSCVADGDGKAFDVEELKVLKPTPPKTLAPAAADAFLLVQDLVQLVNADQPLWLVGLTEMTRTFGLDLLESVLTMFPRIFFQHPEFGYLLKERVCALVIQLFSPNIKYRASHAGGGGGAVSHSSPSVLYDKPYFPITLRLLRLVGALIHHYYPLLVTQCEIFLSLLVKFLECSDRPEWQRCLALEVLHNLTTQPHLLLQFTRHYDCRPHSTNIFQDIVNSLGAFVQSLFLAGGTSSGGASGGGGGSSGTTTTTHTQGTGVVVSSHSPSLLAGLPVGPGVSATPAFCYRGVYLPLVASLALTSQPKPVYLQLVDKLEPPVIPEGYSVTLACLCLLETTRSIQRLLLQRQDRLDRESSTTESLSTSDLDTVPVKLSASEESPASPPPAGGEGDALPTTQVPLQEQVLTVPLDEEVEVALSDGPDSPGGGGRPAPQQESSSASTPPTRISKEGPVSPAGQGSGGNQSGPAEEEVLSQLVTSAWCGLLAALSTLLEACTEEAATESILQAFQSMAWVSGTLGLSTPRDAFITALCKSCLPPHYTLTVLNTPQSSPGSGSSAPPSTGGTTKPQQHIHQSYHDAEVRQQVVAVGSALPTSATPSGAQQGPVMLTNKNLQVMRAVLSLAHCHGGVLASAWHLVLTTLQHLVWVLGLKPAAGGSLKQSSRANNDSNAVITTAVIADLPVLSSMLSRLFESSAQLDDVALHHLIDALCQLSSESMQLAYTNREPSLFAVAKLLETGLVNLSRVEAFWRPITSHLLEVCQHPHARMREWGVEALTHLVRTALTHPDLMRPPHSRNDGGLPLRDNQRLQSLLLSPLSELSSCSHADVRQKQLETLLTVLHSCGEQLQHGWPTILTVIAAVNDNHSEALVRLAFQCLQLVVTDFLPVMPWRCLPLTVASAAKFGEHTQELNISLTAIGLMWNISDYFYQNQDRVRSCLSSDSGPAFPAFPGVPDMPPFDKLWMCLYARLGDLCVDGRPAVRKSASQTLFSTIAAHGSLLHNATWQAVLWQVLFPLLDKVRQLSASASTEKVDEAGNILIHHSRNTHQKQWAETQVMTLSGCARVFSTKQHLLLGLPDYPRAWALMLDFIHTAALSRTNEVSLAALKSMQEMLQSSRSPPTASSSEATPTDASGAGPGPKDATNNGGKKKLQRDDDEEVANWNTAWKMWHSIGVEVTRPPSGSLPPVGELFVPTQPFLTALLHTLTHLFQHVLHRLGSEELRELSEVLQGSVQVPVAADSAAFVLPSSSDSSLVTPLQDAVLAVLHTLLHHVTAGGFNAAPDQANNNSSSNAAARALAPETSTTPAGGSQGPADPALACLVPQVFSLLLHFASYSYKLPSWGGLHTRPYTNKGGIGSPAEYVTPPYATFSERCLGLAVRLYQVSATWPPVLAGRVLEAIVQCCSPGLGQKYLCPSWRCLISALLTVLETGLPLARLHPQHHASFWATLNSALDGFLFSSSPPPPNQSGEEAEADEELDCRVVQLLQEQVLPHPSTTPPHFLMSAMVLLNKGSIHSAPTSELECGRLREQFAKCCFETLLQFSLFSPGHALSDADAGSHNADGAESNTSGAPLLGVAGEGVTSKLAVTSLLHRFKDVLCRFVDDAAISGGCPLPRHRLAEVSFVLQAIATLLSSLQSAPPHKVDAMTWRQLIGLYPHLVEAGGGGGSFHPNLWRSLKTVLLQFAPLLQPPLPHTDASSPPSGRS